MTTHLLSHSEAQPKDLGVCIVVVLWVALFLAVGCQSPDAPDFDNALDPTDPNYIPPSAVITAGPSDGETVTDADVSFTWTGVERVTEYRHRLDEADWTDWSSMTSVEFKLLDEGDHGFEVMSRYPTGDEQTVPTARTLTVDAVKGPALMFRPRRVVVAPGETFSVEVIAEEVEDLMGARVRITYDATALRLQDIEEGGLLSGNGGTVVFLDVQEDGALTIDTAVAEGTPAGTTGTGAIATLTFVAQREGEAALSYADDSALRTSSNQDIPLNALEAGAAVVREDGP